jgi:ATP adenylyltransferase
MKYIKENSSHPECPFCKAISEGDDRENLVIHRGKYAFVMLNRYPYTTGHILVLPYIHQEKMSEFDPKTRSEMIELVNQAGQVLELVYKPEGLNVGLNLGTAAGAGIPKHLHWHLVPRWMGDTNFMTTVGNVRVLPESLEDSYQKIQSSWDK